VEAIVFHRTALVALATLGALFVAPTLPAQQPGGGVAQQFLAHTGDLNLTDQQVVRLAAIARREHQRRSATRAAIDSARALRMRQPRDSMRPMAPRFDQAAAERARGQRQADLRDALAVLSPDQLATAWQTIASRGRGRAGGPGMMMRGGRGAPGTPGARGARGARGGRPMMGDSVPPRGGVRRRPPG
jgi:hypothetical protein